MAGTPVRYRICPKEPRAHLLAVEVTVDLPVADGQVFSLPVWIPGSYLVREFARHVVDIKADSGGRPVPLVKLDKHRWRAAPVAGPLTVQLTIYAWDLSVRAAHVDQTHAFFNGTSVFPQVEGFEAAPCEVTIDPPSDEACKGWRVATTLPPVDARPVGFGTYRADSYQHLVDHPVEMGTWESVDFLAEGIPHQMAITGRVRFDRERLAKDLAAVCGEHQRMFHAAPQGDGAAAIERYLFLTTALGDGYGGLEHADSSALICKRDDLPKPSPTSTPNAEPSDGYRSFLGLCSHEYFHLWNVKRIKPAAFSPYRLDSESYTRLLWAFEGVTSYYDDLALVRAGVITVESWLELLGRTATRVLRAAGRKRQSIAESSFDAWIKFYRPDENTPNAVVSYYTKGALVALALDLTIRQATDERRSLDDVLRALWLRHGKTGVGVPEDGVERLAAEIAGADLRPFFDEYVRGTADVPLGPLLAPYGIEAVLRPAESDHDQGGKAAKKPVEELAARGVLGITLGSGDDGAHLAHVHDGGAAQAAGLSAGDVVVAVDGLRATRTNLLRLCGERPPGARLHVHAFRRDELLELEVVLRAPEHDVAYFTLRAGDDAADGKRAAWLTPHKQA
ncbi:MAG: M61 family metallopeptidase [Deltaproteobacteria bacterium]|nr:M61 family metallopeptidase [Deltaproteobacteria bacterium]